ncbi:MAG: hypothetical protein INQ03_05205 [Candidatus Heimdallarchaeota archaeon]|nr:hypothetical protein [Candidatus Heimdallarchaeota archaeon]
MSCIKFIGIRNGKKAIKQINEVLEKNKELVISETLPLNIEECCDDFYVTIKKRKLGFYIDMGPKSGEGHDFGIEINTKDKTMDMWVGEVISDSEE